MINPKLLNFVLKIAILFALLAIVASVVLVIKASFLDEPEVPRTAVERDIMDAEAAVKADPLSEKARVALSLAYSKVGRYNEAIEQADVAIRLDKSSVQAYYARGAARARVGDVQRAIDDLEHATKLKSGNNEVYQQAFFELGELYMRQGNYKEAIKAYTGAVGYGPEATYATMALANAYEKAGDIKNAVEQYKIVLDYDPANDEARRALVRLGVKLK